MSAYQLLVSRAKVTAGDEVLTERASVSVRNNVARFTANGHEHTMEVASIEKGRKVATVTGTDGTVWTVSVKGRG